MKLLLRLFPRGFRDRYGDEVLGLIEEGSRASDAADLAVSGLSMRFDDLAGRLRQRTRLMVRAVPLAIGAGAVGAILLGCAVVGAVVGGAGGLYAGAVGMLLAPPVRKES